MITSSRLSTKNPESIFPRACNTTSMIPTVIFSTLPPGALFWCVRDLVFGFVPDTVGPIRHCTWQLTLYLTQHLTKNLTQYLTLYTLSHFSIGFMNLLTHIIQIHRDRRSSRLLVSSLPRTLRSGKHSSASLLAACRKLWAGMEWQIICGTKKLKQRWFSKFTHVHTQTALLHTNTRALLLYLRDHRRPLSNQQQQQQRQISVSAYPPDSLVHILSANVSDGEVFGFPRGNDDDDAEEPLWLESQRQIFRDR